MTVIRVAQLNPNPFRALGTYPVLREKVDALKESIKETTFWDNVLARKSPTGGGYELAYGHHRLQALKELRIAEIDIPIRKLSDTDMLRIMAHENMEEWQHSASIDQETVSITVKALGDGKIVIPSPSKNSPHVRYAPSFIWSKPSSGVAPSTQKPYTAATLAKFLGMKEWKVDAALSALSLIEQKVATENTFADLTADQADAVAKQTSRVINESKKSGDDEQTAKKKGSAVARELAAGMRKASGKKITAEDKKKVTHEKITPRNAKAQADRILGNNRKQSSPKPKSIDSLINRFLEGLAQAFTKRADSLRIIVEHKDMMPASLLRNVLGSLKSIQHEVGILIDKLESDKNSSYSVAPRVLAITDQSK